MERRAITIAGVVQGVGFRPFVYRVATHLGLRGFVRNQAGAVYIDVEGSTATLDRFIDEVQHSAPSIARIESLQCQTRQPVYFDRFSISSSKEERSDEIEGIFVSPDIATCDACLAEIFDPADRRHEYAFTNCTNCGPRLTIVRSAPYDRPNTTMREFSMCDACRAEYEDPADRRFHAQPIACPVCGPRLEVVDANGARIESNGIDIDPLDCFATVLKLGGIGALKGLGGYHLACDARRQDSVGELRRRKHREEMPLAVMLADVEQVERYCHVTTEERRLLESSRRPIVLLRKLAADESLMTSEDRICEAVAPGNPYLGVMLPYTPLHHLLLRKMSGIPLVMTSGNRSHEPIAYADDDALSRLGKIADIFLRHNRPIHVRCDDSVTRIIDGRESPIRRSRGYAPLPLDLPLELTAPVLAVGGQFKGVFGLGRAAQAILSHHLGDLDQWEAYRQFERDIALYETLFQTSPRWIAHDLHPDYASTQYAIARSEREDLPRLAVQHHHAHMASCMAENGLNEHSLDGPVIGVTFDGTGYGRDETSGEATIWGGEFLAGSYLGFRRAARLRNVPMPGGDAAVREPWRMAASHLLDAGRDLDLYLLNGRHDAFALKTIETMCSRRFNAPLTSSMGRLFDAVASLAGIRDRTSYEGQAAMECEWLATVQTPDTAYPFAFDGDVTDAEDGLPMVIDTRPIIAAVADDALASVGAARIARRWHSTVVAMTVETCCRIRQALNSNKVVLSGGVFMNAIVSSEVTRGLQSGGFEVFRHRLVPPNDAGLALGQLAIAAARIAAGSTDSRLSLLRQPHESGATFAERKATIQTTSIG